MNLQQIEQQRQQLKTDTMIAVAGGVATGSILITMLQSIFA